MKKMKRPEKWGRKWKIPWILVWSLLICSLSSDISLNFSRPQFPQLEPKACRVLTGAHDGHSDWTILYFPYCPRQGSIFSSPAPLAPSKRQQHSHPCNMCHQHKRKAPTFPSGPERTLEVQPVKPLFFQEKPCSGHRGMTVEPGETSRPRLSTPGPQPLHDSAGRQQREGALPGGRAAGRGERAGRSRAGAERRAGPGKHRAGPRGGTCKPARRAHYEGQGCTDHAAARGLPRGGRGQPQANSQSRPRGARAQSQTHSRERKKPGTLQVSAPAAWVTRGRGSGVCERIRVRVLKTAYAVKPARHKSTNTTIPLT